PLPGLRPGFLGAATRVPLEKGAAGRWPSRLRRSTSACKASTLAINSAIWWCCARTSFTKSSRLNAVREAGKLMVHDCRLASQFLQAANQLRYWHRHHGAVVRFYEQQIPNERQNLTV